MKHAISHQPGHSRLSTEAANDLVHMCAQMCVAPSEFVAAMRHAAAGVTLVTTDGIAGRFGMTVSAFTSVSAEPPLVLVCINRTSPLVEAIQANRVFTINVLSKEQQSLADCFAGRPNQGMPYDFDRADWQTGVTGAPLLVPAVSSFDCEIFATHDYGTHRVLIGLVVDTVTDGGIPLVYADRRYAHPAPLAARPSLQQSPGL